MDEITPEEQAEFAGLIDQDIRYLALQENISGLSRTVLTPKGRRFLAYCTEERDTIRRKGYRYGYDLYEIP